MPIDCKICGYVRTPVYTSHPAVSHHFVRTRDQHHHRYCSQYSTLTVNSCMRFYCILKANTALYLCTCTDMGHPNVHVSCSSVCPVEHHGTEERLITTPSRLATSDDACQNDILREVILGGQHCPLPHPMTFIPRNVLHIPPPRLLLGSPAIVMPPHIRNTKLRRRNDAPPHAQNPDVPRQTALQLLYRDASCLLQT
ncbi:hypothetical protein BDW22DRAFT_281918 [Trametopsis cervina]|nr:hypothetical protein BDW22DRAFT_281918 [Trametopsis cervina]